MNEKTKESLLDFITAIENLAAAVMITTGAETASSVVDKAEKLKWALSHDETLP